MRPTLYFCQCLSPSRSPRSRCSRARTAGAYRIPALKAAVPLSTARRRRLPTCALCRVACRRSDNQEKLDEDDYDVIEVFFEQ